MTFDGETRPPAPLSRRRGLTLVEILIAGFIMTVLMIPISQLIFGGTARTKIGRDRASAVTIASDIMGELVTKVPYDVIVPDNGPTALASMLTDAEEPGLQADTAQAELTDDWERLVDDSPGDQERIIVRNGTRFEVILFAGHYSDDDASRDASGFNRLVDLATLQRELTFSYFRNPYVQVQADTRDLVTLPDPDNRSPYEAGGEAVPGVAVTDVHDPRYRAGWPSEPVVDEASFDEDVALTWARHTLDQSDFREDNSLMKLVLGLRWDSAGAGFKGSGASATTKEFWLVSFKARLED